MGQNRAFPVGLVIEPARDDVTDQELIAAGCELHDLVLTYTSPLSPSQENWALTGIQFGQIRTQNAPFPWTSWHFGLKDSRIGA
jgi:hypothetical protein